MSSRLRCGNSSPLGWSWQGSAYRLGQSSHSVDKQLMVACCVEQYLSRRHSGKRSAVVLPSAWYYHDLLSYCHMLDLQAPEWCLQSCSYLASGSRHVQKPSWVCSPFCFDGCCLNLRYWEACYSRSCSKVRMGGMMRSAVTTCCSHR